MNDRNDLTTGVIWKKLILFFLPIAAGTIFQQLYNAVDAIVVGKFVGTEALAAVGGSPATFINLLLGFFVALSGGAGVVIAQRCGAKDGDMVSREIHTAVTFCFLIGIALFILVLFFAPEVLVLLKTPADTLKDAVLYTRIYFGGSIFMLLFNMGSGILRALGDSRRPFIYLLVSCLSNIILDLFFVIALDLGVAGVAWATVIAQGLSTILILINLARHDNYPLRLRLLGIDREALKEMLRIGVPSGLQSSMYGVSNMILQIGVNTLGTVVVASWSMCGKIDGIYWAISGAFGTAVMNFVAQNYGAHKTDRIKSCTRTGLKLFTIATLLLSTGILLLAKPVLHIFTDDPALMETTWKLLTYFVPTYILWTVIEIFSGVLRGVGDALKPFIILALGVCLLRVVWVLTVFQSFHTLFVISISYPISWAVTDVAMLLYYFKGSIFKRSKSE